MNLSRPLIAAVLSAAVLLVSGCAHRGAMQSDAPPQSDVIAVADASEDALATNPTDPTAASEGEQSAQAPADATADAGAVDLAAEALPSTEAEQDFAALYGTPDPESEYDPIADATLPEPVVMPQSYDPWEKFNRRMYRFNAAVDRRVAKPLARAYVKVVPRPVRLGVSNFFHNLGQPVSALNALLQGKPKQAGQSIGRFLLNSTVGIAGLFDPATAAKIPNRSEDFGQTLGVWGWKKSRYVELPLFGPRTLRDAFGMVGDAPLSPLRQVEEDRVRVFLQGLQLVDVRTQLLTVDNFREGASDEYALIRDAWLQRRNYQIFGDLRNTDDQTLPDYLLEEENNPTVPIDAMPMPETP